MSKQTTRSTGKSTAFLSEREIDIWGNDARRKARLFESSLSKQLTHKQQQKIINNEEQFDVSFTTSINRLRQKTRSQKSHSSSLSNRINYLQVDLHRKKQMVEIARNKYQRMVAVRNQSFVEKKSLSSDRQQLLQHYYQTVSFKAKKIRLERENSAISSQLWVDKNQEEAGKIKEKTVMNQKAIAERAQLEVERKRRLVEKSHETLQASRRKMRDDHNQIIERGRKVHHSKLFQQYLKGETQQRKNAKLRDHLEKRMRIIADAKMKYCTELQEYEHQLGLRLNLPRDDQSLFITHDT